MHTGSDLIIILALKTCGIPSPAGKSWFAVVFLHARKVLPSPQPTQQVLCLIWATLYQTLQVHLGKLSQNWNVRMKRKFFGRQPPHMKGFGKGESVPGPTFPQYLPSLNPTSWQSPWAAAASQPCRVTTREYFLAFIFFIQLATTFFPPRSKTGPQTSLWQGTLQSQEHEKEQKESQIACGNQDCLDFLLPWEGRALRDVSDSWFEDKQCKDCQK